MLSLFLLLICICKGALAEAARPFPYSTRTRDYSAWTPATRGDINTIGMAGATVAVPTSIAAAEANPAGFSMQTASVSAQVNKVSFSDKQIQRSDEKIDSSQWGLGVSPSSWGFSIAYYSPMTESGNYISPDTGRELWTEVSLKEFRFTVAHSFFDDESLAIGLGPEIVKAVREIGATGNSAWGASYRLGALYRLPTHAVLGASFSPRTTVGPASDPQYQDDMPGFNRSVVLPMKIDIGAGWLPNRFFKAGLSLSYVGATQNTALLADETVSTGAHPTWVPRLGASYVIAEFAKLKIEAAAGAYYEVSRLDDYPDRIHGTGGLEVNPYFVNLGAGFDISSGYKNVIFSIGIDIVRTARTFELIPKDPVPPYDGFWPRADHVSADGLPAGLTMGEPKKYSEPGLGDVKDIVQQIPEKIKKKTKTK